MNEHAAVVSGEGTSSAGRIQSVVRALTIVDMVAASASPMRTKEIAEAMDLHLATTAHLLSSLVQMGYLERHKREYVLGRRKILHLASLVEADWSPTPHQMQLLQNLVAKTGETAYISSLRRDSVSMDAVVEGTQSVRVAGLSIGTIGHIHARASGKVLLAFSSETQRRALLTANGPLTARTPHTITDQTQLAAELDDTRARGYAIDREEFALGIGGAAVPLFEGNQPPRRALSITAPIHRFQDPSMFDLYTSSLIEASRSSSES